MANIKALTLVLFVLIASAKCLPLDTNFSEDSSDNSSSDSIASAERTAQKSEDSSDSSVSSSESDDVNAEIQENQEVVDSLELENDTAEARVLKRSPYIPDPDLVKEKSKEYDSDEHATHDEYLEWKRKLPRYRREAGEDEEDDDNALAENDIEAQEETLDNEIVMRLIDDSLEGYAQGCEVAESEPEDINETTYNEEYRRKREVSNESEASENDEENPIEATENASDEAEVEDENEAENAEATKNASDEETNDDSVASEDDIKDDKEETNQDSNETNESVLQADQVKATDLEPDISVEETISIK